MLEELTQEEETKLFLKCYKERYNLFAKELTELLFKSCREKYNVSEKELEWFFSELYKEKYNLSNRQLEELFLEVYKEHNLSAEELKKLYFKLYEENRNLFEEELKESFLELYKKKHNLFEEELKESFLELYKKKHNLSEEELKELFLELYKEQHNLSEEELLEFKHIYNTKEVESLVERAAYYDLLPVIKYFIENGGNPYFVIEEFGEEVTILNIAARKGSLDIINYLFDNNVFTVDQRASENAKTPFHSAVESDSIKAVEFLLQKGADINAEFNCVGQVKTAWLFVVQLNFIEMAKFLLKHNVCIPELSYSYNVPELKDFLLPIKKLENLYITAQGNDFINTYNSSTPEVQAIWDARVSYLTHENSGTTIAGASLDNNNIAGDHS
ncbi:hypothetical protein H6P87_00876 [Rickettsia tillamookensis]|uniref:Ankyrin repeat protein n=1 Tax=Rickettsia tillamookensis TaxID=2761623 RepID=A0A9E6MIJ1_9RICK|nr:ankyrin repeat domain-containing protein [Rickettsia tillamookensis]QQV75323.1 hypothetical protein H6P87_00876 [Rickettsia tillamookensis]